MGPELWPTPWLGLAVALVGWGPASLGGTAGWAHKMEVGSTGGRGGPTPAMKDHCDEVLGTRARQAGLLEEGVVA